eukprot:12115443-Karenia_brevis.AAC.1
MVNQISKSFDPCGHGYWCTDCAEFIFGGAVGGETPRCPLCREPITGVREGDNELIDGDALQNAQEQ